MAKKSNRIVLLVGIGIAVAVLAVLPAVLTGKATGTDSGGCGGPPLDDDFFDQLAEEFKNSDNQAGQSDIISAYSSALQELPDEERTTRSKNLHDLLAGSLEKRIDAAKNINDEVDHLQVHLDLLSTLPTAQPIAKSSKTTNDASLKSNERPQLKKVSAEIKAMVEGISKENNQPTRNVTIKAFLRKLAKLPLDEQKQAIQKLKDALAAAKDKV